MLCARVVDSGGLLQPVVSSTYSVSLGEVDFAYPVAIEYAERIVAAMKPPPSCRCRTSVREGVMSLELLADSRAHGNEYLFPSGLGCRAAGIPLSAFNSSK